MLEKVNEACFPFLLMDRSTVCHIKASGFKQARQTSLLFQCNALIWLKSRLRETENSR